MYFNIEKWHASPLSLKWLFCLDTQLIGACRDTHYHTSLTGGHTWGIWQGRGCMNPGLTPLQFPTTICHKPKTRQTTQGLSQWKNRAVPKKCRREKTLLAIVQHLGRQMVRERFHSLKIQPFLCAKHFITASFRTPNWKEEK